MGKVTNNPRNRGEEDVEAIVDRICSSDNYEKMSYFEYLDSVADDIVML
jgi:hypothetical protein